MIVMPSNNDPDDSFIPPVLNMDETFMDENIDMNVTEVYTMEHIAVSYTHLTLPTIYSV